MVTQTHACIQVTFNNMPMLVVGASDCFASFCPGVIALSTNETQQQYEQILRLADSMVCSPVCSRDFSNRDRSVDHQKSQFGGCVNVHSCTWVWVPARADTHKATHCRANLHTHMHTYTHAETHAHRCMHTHPHPHTDTARTRGLALVSSCCFSVLGRCWSSQEWTARRPSHTPCVMAPSPFSTPLSPCTPCTACPLLRTCGVLESRLCSHECV